MPKFTFVLVIVALAVAVQGSPTFEDDVAAAAKSGNWDKVHEILSRSFQRRFDFQPPVQTGDVRSLKPQGGGHVFAESDVSFSTSTNNNGHVSSQSAGHKVINDDGKVSEYDYKPNFYPQH